MDLVQAQLQEQVQRPLELFFRLPGEAHYDVGVDGHVRHGFPYPADQVYVLGPAVLTPHLIQYPVVARLHRQIDVLADLGQVCDGLDYLLSHELGVGGQETDALDAVYIVQPGE